MIIQLHDLIQEYLNLGDQKVYEPKSDLPSPTSTEMMPESTDSVAPLNPVITIESCRFEKDLCGFENSGFDFLGNYITPMMIRVDKSTTELETEREGMSQHE